MLNVTILVAVIIGVVQVFRKLGLATKYAPLLALVLGILAYGFSGGWDFPNLFQGIIAGLTASGLYSGVKTTVVK